MLKDVEELDLISAIWIMASNDETPLITYGGIRYRLDLPADYDVKALVAKRPELFRPSANPEHLEAWKADMLDGRRLPSWIRVIHDEEVQANTIRSLTVHDVFRSQFRASRNSERSPIEIIKWGLEHLDRLRKAKAEAKDAGAKSWQMWLIFGVGVAGILAQIVVAALKGASGK
jgi:hypothetical protein